MKLFSTEVSTGQAGFKNLNFKLKIGNLINLKLITLSFPSVLIGNPNIRTKFSGIKKTMVI